MSVVTYSAVLQYFRVAYKKIPTYVPEKLKDAGVPDNLIDLILRTHFEARSRLAHAELQILYALIPKFDAWLKLANQSRSEFSKWHAIIRHMNTLEKGLGRNRAPTLRKKLDAWRDQTWPKQNRKQQ